MDRTSSEVNLPPPETFEREMHDTRESLRQKVAALEQTVVGTVDAVKKRLDVYHRETSPLIL